MIPAGPDAEHIREAILAAHQATVRAMNARSRRALLKNIRAAMTELEKALVVVPREDT
jgi:acyl-CoA reductase-like NAD-dependent aldehyde dehydrogenase